MIRRGRRSPSASESAADAEGEFTFPEAEAGSTGVKWRISRSRSSSRPCHSLLDATACKKKTHVRKQPIAKINAWFRIWYRYIRRAFENMSP
jgi:hypothetical protein